MAMKDNETKIANGEKDECVRNLAKFDPDIWGDVFTSFILDTKVIETYNSEVNNLKEQVRDVIVAAGVAARGNTTRASKAELLCSINTIERLGLSYHFEHEIEKQVEWMFLDYCTHKENSSKQESYDLFTDSLRFRICRQHGHKMSTEVFNKYTDSKTGKFMESLSSDIPGMLSLYDAAYLRIHGEDILEEAKSFSERHLKRSLDDKLIPNPLVVEHVEQTLLQPLHLSMQRLKVRQYISFYQGHASKDDTLLLLAKLDFNRLQLIYKQELGNITRWWKDLMSAAEVSHVRNRAVETYFLCGSTFDAPKYSLARTILTKHFLMLTMIDDIYDAFATFKELQPFTDAWQRWDINDVDALPDYMKSIYTAILHNYADIEKDLAKEGMSSGNYYIQGRVKQIARGYDEEAQWLEEGYMPTFDEHLANGMLTSTDTLHASAIAGLGEYGTIEALDYVTRRPKIVLASSVIGRLLNDIAGHKNEQKRKHSPSAIDCYMKTYGVGREKAIEELCKIIWNAWMDINEEMLLPTEISRKFQMPILNIIRNVNTIYTPGSDGFTKPRKVKHHIEALYVSSIPL